MQLPTIEEYKVALKKVLEVAPERHLLMLEAHFLATDHTISARDLAQAAKYESYSAANLQYGKLGRALCEQLSFVPPIGNSEEPTFTYVLASASKPSNSLWLWTLHEPVVAALREINAFDPGRSDSTSALSDSAHANVLSDGSVLDELRPRRREAIYDLLQLAGISTDDWLTKADGQPVARVKANPNFCYNWSFGSIREGYALCIWHETLQDRGGRIVFEENLRDLADRLQADSRNTANDEARRSRALTQATRARAFDDALNVSYARGMAVSVILTEGDRRNREELGEGSSHVQFRSLDPVKWYVHEYSEGAGTALLVRGRVADESGEREADEVGSPDEVQHRAIKVRRGQAQFREKLLAAYRRTCAVTGCKVVDLLEAAHIRPHADEPNYTVTNGLLLRADIHTLFDLGLLTIDTRRRVRLAPALLQSEYRTYEGKELRQPEYPSEMPSGEALERRYREFKAKYGP